jgi:hypothetical protein
MFLLEYYVTMRKEIKKPLTPTAAKMLVCKIVKLEAEGHSAVLLLDKATERQWQTMYPADDTKALPRKIEFVVMTPEEAAASWEREVAANV